MNYKDIRRLSNEYMRGVASKEKAFRDSSLYNKGLFLIDSLLVARISSSLGKEWGHLAKVRLLNEYFRGCWVISANEEEINYQICCKISECRQDLKKHGIRVLPDSKLVKILDEQ